MTWKFGFPSLLLAAALSACGSLPVSLPGQNNTPEPPAVEVAEREDPANGVAGAAMCIASAFYLADASIMAEDQAMAAAEIWTGILDVIPSTEAERQKAVDDSYAAFEGLDDRSDQGGLRAAGFQYSSEGTCRDQAFQRDFLDRFGDPALMEQQLGGGS